jgi:hypothetical protein
MFIKEGCGTTTDQNPTPSGVGNLKVSFVMSKKPFFIQYTRYLPRFQLELLPD